MTLATAGLVLHTTPYGESSVVIKIFTRELGLRSYIMKGVRSRTSRTKQNLLQAMSSLDLVVYNNHRNALNHIREISPRRPWLPSDPIGNALRFFAAEVLYRSLPEGEPLPLLWDFAEQWSADSSGKPVDFLLKVTEALGVAPLDNYQPYALPFFDLTEGRFVGLMTENTLPVNTSLCLHLSLDSSQENPPLTPAQRSNLLEAIIAYMQLHVASFHHLSSHQILHEVLSPPPIH